MFEIVQGVFFFVCFNFEVQFVQQFVECVIKVCYFCYFIKSGCEYEFVVFCFYKFREGQ